jgi:hypothetical protein
MKHERDGRSAKGNHSTTVIHICTCSLFGWTGFKFQWKAHTDLQVTIANVNGLHCTKLAS